MKTVILPSCLLFCFILKGVYSTPNRTYVSPRHLEELLRRGLYEEFAKLVNIDDVDLVKPAQANRTDDPLFNKGMGDMLYKPMRSSNLEQNQVGEEKGYSTYYDQVKWPTYVPYVIQQNGGFTSEDRKRIEAAIAQWNLNFRGYVTYRRRNREKDYVFIFNGQGCYSYLGRQGGQQPLSLQRNGCLSPGTVLHEMSHAVGIIHEHTRRDRDNYVKVLFDNIPKDWWDQYEKVDKGLNQILGPYDYYSVMHYPYLAPDTNKPAFEILKQDVNIASIGQRVGQTQTDIEKIKYLYS